MSSATPSFSSADPASSSRPPASASSLPAAAAARIVAIIGASGVALGAFGAHALKSHLLASERLGTWETAVLYHLIHALLLALLAHRFPSRPLPFWLCLAGIVLFSGSLYLLCLTDWSALGAVTPIGGALLIAAWLSLFFPTTFSRSSYSNPSD